MEQLAVGVGLTYSRTTHGVDATGTVPHPLFYNQPRELELQLGGFNRTDLGIHLHAAWIIRLAGRLDLALSAGPSLLAVEIDRLDPVSDAFDVRETAPYNEVQLHFGRESVQERVPAASVGIDLTYHFYRSLTPAALFWTAGIGVFARWTMPISPLPEFGPDETLDVGGLRAGGGLRFRF